MRNLKKVLAVILTVAMLASFMVPAFAAVSHLEEAKKLQAIGLFAGGEADLKLDEDVTRIQGLTFAIRAAGKEAEALAMTDEEVAAELAKFKDSDTVPSWNGNGPKYVAYAIKNGITVGDGQGNFKPLDKISGRAFLVFLLKSGMGYKDVTTLTAPDVAVDAGVLTPSQAMAYAAAESGIIRDDAAAILFGAATNGVNADGKTFIQALIDAGFVDAQTAIENGFVNVTELSVIGISATSPKTFLVKFNRAVTDDDKVTFEVKRLTTTTSVTVTWNDAKTEATLTGASNFAESDYTVRVLKDGAQIASETISITPQKINKIEFTSPSVAVTIGSNTGYVTYKVYDQYGNDITTTAKANSLSVQSSVGTPQIKNGLMTITTDTTGGDPSLAMIQNLTVVLYDASTGISSTAALPISTTAGTLSDFQFNLTDNLTIKEGDNTTVYYIPYVAKDMAGNETKDYDLITGGLIDADAQTKGTQLVVSLNNKVSAEIVKDPSNSKLAAVEVKYSGKDNDLVMDMPVTITAMTLTGKTSVAQLTLAKSKAVDSLILLAPAETVAANETPEIPFEAYDQYGNRVTGYSDIKSSITHPNGFTIKEKSDGTAKFVMEASPKGIKSLSATLKSGKVSNILNINVQDAAKPASIAIARADFISAMEQKATQSLNIGNDTAKDELRVYDQYDRLMNDEKIMSFIGGDTPTHKITATVTGDVTLTGADPNITGTGKTVTDLTLTAKDVNGGSGKIEFELIELGVGGAPDKTLDTVSTPITVVKTGDITSYTINTADAEKVLYASVDRATVTPTARDNEYAYTAKVYGRTDAGTQVLLAGTPIVASSITNGADFVVTSVEETTPVAYNGVKVNAKGLDNNRTEASTDLVVTVAHNNTVKPLTVTLKSSTAAPVANEIKLKGADGDGLVVADLAKSKNYLIQKYAPENIDSDGDKNDDIIKGAKTGSSFYFYIADSYGKEGMTFVSFRIAKAKVKVKDTATGTDTEKIVSADEYNENGNNIKASIDNNGLLKITDNAANGDVIYVTAVTNNGRSATMMIQVKKDTAQTTP